MKLRVNPAITLALTGALLLGVNAQAGTVTRSLLGDQTAAENGCVDAIAIFTANDCSYGGVNRWWSDQYYDPELSNFVAPYLTPPYVLPVFPERTLITVNTEDREDRAWIGPLANHMYYKTGSSPFTKPPVAPALRGEPAVGDDKARLGLSGSLTIDNNDTLDGSDDLISGTIVIAAGTRNVLTGQAANSRVEESWTSLTQTWAPTAVHSATPNANGGFDYVIASRGMPDDLLPAGLNDQPYPSEIASSPIVASNSGWAAPEPQARGVASFECYPESPTQVEIWTNAARTRRFNNSPYGAPCADASQQNIGIRTTGVFSGWSCLAYDPTKACPNNEAIIGKGPPGIDNLLLAVSTDANGDIVSAEAKYAYEYPVLGFLFRFTGPEGWDGGKWQFNSPKLRVRPSGGSPDVNLKSGGSVSVVLYSNSNLDATTATNLTMGSASEVHGITHVVTVDADLDGFLDGDLNKDGLLDAVLHFTQKDIGLSCGDTTATLNGQTSDGRSFSATGTVNVVGC
jgi:hypothetical protein